MLSLKAPITTAADDIHKNYHCLSEKIRLDVSSESSARQRIHMKNQALFSSKDKSKKIKCRLLQFLCGALRFKASTISIVRRISMKNTCKHTFHIIQLIIHIVCPISKCNFYVRNIFHNLYAQVCKFMD